MATTFAPKISQSTGSFARQDGHSVTGCLCAVLSDGKDKFKESETI